MPKIQIEFTDDTLVATDLGIVKLTDLLQRSVRPSLWAIKWTFRGVPNGISFHKNHKVAKYFAMAQIDSSPSGPARLVEVSQWLYDSVKQNGFCWTSLSDFEEAKYIRGQHVSSRF